MKTTDALLPVILAAALIGVSPERPALAASPPHPGVTITIGEDGGVVIETSAPVEIRYESPAGSPIAYVAKRTAVAFRTARTLGSVWFRTAKTIAIATSRPIIRYI
jgi:hypothetical protein